MGSNLMLHTGAKEVSRTELATVEAPPPAKRWYPIKHATVLEALCTTLTQSGFLIEKERLGLSESKHRFFGTLDLRSELAHGVTLAVGVRNSTDQTFPLGFCAGSRVFVCDNLAFRSELMVRRKHTLHGATRFQEAITEAIGSLPQFMAGETQRIDMMQSTEIPGERAESLILRSYEQGIVSARFLPDVIRAWREPSAPEFEPRTLWSLFNAVTQVLKPRSLSNPQAFAVQTMRLHSLMNPPEN